jgi:hypothetical protein
MEKRPRKRQQHLRVPVNSEEKRTIEANAQKAGISVARYLREVGQGYVIKGVLDYQHVRELVRINGDLGRLGGLLKLWLTNDVKVSKFSDATILALLDRIEATRDKMSQIMQSIVQPKNKA